MPAENFLSVGEAARTLGVSTRHVGRLADSGAIARLARGVVDRGSVDRYLASQSKGRTRAWAEHTAWGAVAILTGQDAPWMGATQISRLRTALRRTTDVDELLTRMRNRAQLRLFDAHRAALPRLRDIVTTTDTRAIGLASASDGSVDGYLADRDLEDVVRSLGLRAAVGGSVTLRVTGCDVDQVRHLIASPVVAALDVATSSDPRLRGVGHRALGEALEAYR